MLVGELVVVDGQSRLNPGSTGRYHPPRRRQARRGSAQQEMSLSGLFIRRPIMTSLIMIAIAVFGIVAYRSLAISDLPTVDYLQ